MDREDTFALKVYRKTRVLGLCPDQRQSSRGYKEAYRQLWKTAALQLEIQRI